MRAEGYQQVAARERRERVTSPARPTPIGRDDLPRASVSDRPMGERADARRVSVLGGDPSLHDCQSLPL